MRDDGGCVSNMPDHSSHLLVEGLPGRHIGRGAAHGQNVYFSKLQAILGNMIGAKARNGPCFQRAYLSTSRPYFHPFLQGEDLQDFHFEMSL